MNSHTNLMDSTEHSANLSLPPFVGFSSRGDTQKSDDMCFICNNNNNQMLC